MNTHADKTQENTSSSRSLESQTVANVVSQKKNGGASTFQFEDNRPEAIVQRKLQKMANDQFNKPVQKQELEEEELLQGKFEPVQKKVDPERSRRENNTGLTR